MTAAATEVSVGGRTRLGIGGVLLSLAVLFVLQPPASTAFWSALFSAGHAPLFGLIAICLYGVARDREPFRENPTAPYFIAFAGAALIGAGTELAQLLDAGRNASWLDWFRDLAGAAAFLLITAAIYERPFRRSRVWRLGGGALAGLLLAAVAAPVVSVLHHYQQRSAAFPVLADFHSRWQSRFLEIRGAEIAPVESSGRWHDGRLDGVARVTFAPGLYPGITIHEPYPDWTAHEFLVMEAYSSGPESVGITLRVHDHRHNHQFADRFNRSFEIRPGYNRFSVPLEEIQQAPQAREMNMLQIAGVTIFAFRNERPFTVELGPLVLQ